MEMINLKPLLHNKQECIGIYFEQNSVLNSVLLKAGARWTRTHKCWYIQCSEENYKIIWRAVKGKATLDIKLLKSFLEEKKGKSSLIAPAQKKKADQIILPSALPQAQSGYLCNDNRAALQQFQQHLVLKAYSPSTIRTYTIEFKQLLVTLREFPAKDLTVPRIKDYLEYCFTTLKLSEATLHSKINALKFYYEQVLGKDKFFWEIPRPKKPFQLPKVLSENEIGRMFNAITNIKHKAILFTAYSAGMRVSEVINLKLTDIDSERMQILIEKAKGKKDRYVGLGILLLDVLRAYLKTCHPLPKKYVFENPAIAGHAYSVRSVQQIFQMAKERAMINKDVGIHSLRHSFATHLLEKGIDIRYIKDLLGHLSIKTTEKYLHVKRETLINIPNLLDELDKSYNLDW